MGRGVCSNPTTIDFSCWPSNPPTIVFKYDTPLPTYFLMLSRCAFRTLLWANKPTVSPTCMSTEVYAQLVEHIKQIYNGSYVGYFSLCMYISHMHTIICSSQKQAYPCPALWKIARAHNKHVRKNISDLSHHLALSPVSHVWQVPTKTWDKVDTHIVSLASAVQDSDSFSDCLR